MDSEFNHLLKTDNRLNFANKYKNKLIVDDCLQNNFFYYCMKSAAEYNAKQRQNTLHHNYRHYMIVSQIMVRQKII